MAIAVFGLIAENIENFGILAGFNKTVAAISLQKEADIFTRTDVFYRKLLFKLSECKSRDSNPTNR
jgi:hypothetical protein